VDDGLRDLRPDAADDAFRAHQADGADGLEQVLRHQRVDGGHAGDVDDGQGGAGVDDALQQRLHHHLGAARVQRADHRHRQHAFEQLDDRGGQLQQVLLLAADDVLAGLLVGGHRQLRHAVDQGRQGPDGRDLGGRVGDGALQGPEHGPLECLHEHAGVGSRLALGRARPRQAFERLAQRLPGRALECLGITPRLQSGADAAHDLGRLALHGPLGRVRHAPGGCCPPPAAIRQ
jgi:hypothetical protein